MTSPLTHIVAVQPGLRIMAAAAYTVLEGKSKSSEEMQSTATFRTLKAFFAVRPFALLASDRNHGEC